MDETKRTIKYSKDIIQKAIVSKSRSKVGSKGKKKTVKKHKFDTGNRVVVACDDAKKIKNNSIIFKSGKIIGMSAVRRNKYCIEFDVPIVGGNSSNSGRFTGKPFQCFYVYGKYLKPYDEEVVKKLKAAKEKLIQKEIDDWYAPEEKYF